MLNGLLALLWAVWLGSVVFFSFIVAPTVHSALERPEAHRLLERLFPRYYAVGVACAAVTVVIAIAAGSDLLLTVPLTIAGVLSAYARQVLVPALDAARIDADQTRFGSLHTMSVRMNLVVIAMLFLAGSRIAGF